MQDVLLVLLGIPVGFASSAALWFWLYRYLVPNIVFSEHIGRVGSSRTPSGLRYRIKIMNNGNRDAIDLTIVVRYSARGIGEITSNRSSYKLDISANAIPRLRKGGNRIINIRPEQTDAFQRTMFPPEIRSSKIDGKLNLDDIMKLGTEPKIQMHIFCYDEFSGARKLFDSKEYRAEDIVRGKFDRKSLSIKREK